MQTEVAEYFTVDKEPEFLSVEFVLDLNRRYAYSVYSAGERHRHDSFSANSTEAIEKCCDLYLFSDLQEVRETTY